MIGLVSVACLLAIFDIHERLHALKKDEERARSVVRLASAVRDQYAHVAHTIIIGNESHAKLFREATQRLQGLAAGVREQGGVTEENEVDRIVRASKEIELLFETQILPHRYGARRPLHHRSQPRPDPRRWRSGAQNERRPWRGQEASWRTCFLRANASTEYSTTIVAHVLALLTSSSARFSEIRTMRSGRSAMSASGSASQASWRSRPGPSLPGSSGRDPALVRLTAGCSWPPHGLLVDGNGDR